VIERKPPRIATPSAAALKTGAELYAVFRRHVSLEGPLSAASVAAICEETGLGARRVRELARRFREHPIAESLAPQPKGPKPGTRHAPPEILTAIDQEIEEIFLHRPRPSVREAANQIAACSLRTTAITGSRVGMSRAFGPSSG
jgi:putative transposase